LPEDGCGHAHELSLHVDEGPAAVPAVHRRVCLDQVVLPDGIEHATPVGAAYNPDAHRTVEFGQGVANRNDRLTKRKRGGIALLDRLQLSRTDLQDCKVGERIVVADQDGLPFASSASTTFKDSVPMTTCW
jgi:hypothetical protein